MDQSSLCRRVPLDDAGLQGLGLSDRETTEIVPGDALAPAVVGRDRAAHLLRDDNGLGHGVLAEEKRPVALPVRPRGERLVRVAGDAVRHLRLLDEPNALVLPDLAVIYHLEPHITVLIDGFQVIL